LSVALKAPAQVHWGVNGWQRVSDVATQDTGLGVHVAEVPAAGLAAGDSIQFTFHWRDAGAWEGQDYEVLVTD
jgi:glucoamylase